MFFDPTQAQCRRKPVAASSPATGRCALSERFYQRSQSGRPSPRSSLATQLCVRGDAHFPASKPISRCWSAARRLPLQSGCDSKHRTVRPTRACESREPNAGARAGLPTRYRPVKSPLAALQNAASRRCGKGVLHIADLRAGPVCRLGNFLGGVAGQVFSKSVAKDSATRSAGTTCKPLRPFKNLIGDGNRRFHTQSITLLFGGRQQPRGRRKGKRFLALAKTRFSGLETHAIARPVAARLKPCPDTNRRLMQ